MFLRVFFREQDVDDLMWRCDTHVLFVCKHLFALFSCGSPEAVDGLDASIAGSLCIAQFIAKRYDVHGVFTKLLQSIFKESRIATTFSYSATSCILAPNTIDFVS